MQATRRQFLAGAVLAALGPGIAAPARAANPGAGRVYAGPYGTVFDRTGLELNRYFEGRGFRAIKALPIRTGDAGFNDGLRYDETGVLTGPGQMVLQPCARVEDRGGAGQKDVLSEFHIFATSWAPEDDVASALARTIGALAGPAGLQRERLLLVSTPRFEALKPVVEAAGLDGSRQVVVRDEAAARLAGDGSGHFRHPDPKTGAEVATVSFHYWPDPSEPRFGDAYPLDSSWTEIGEQALSRDDSETATALGLERLVFAGAGLVPIHA